ncbi:hypothetical protein D3C84_1179750 [compost metagenome]
MEGGALMANAPQAPSQLLLQQQPTSKRFAPATQPPLHDVATALKSYSRSLVQLLLLVNAPGATTVRINTRTGSAKPHTSTRIPA